MKYKITSVFYSITLIGLFALLLFNANALNINFHGSGTVLTGDARLMSVTNGYPPYTWSLTTISGKPGILNTYQGVTISFFASITSGSCTVQVTDSTGQTLSTDTIQVVAAPKPIKSFWIWGSAVPNLSTASTVISMASTHQIRDIFVLVKGTSGSLNTTAMAYLIRQSQNLKTNIRIHPWIGCFNDSSASSTYPTVGGDWIDPRDSGYRSYLLNSFIIPILRDHPQISGVHLDYYRYPGNAYNYDTGLSLVGYLSDIKQAIYQYNPTIPISIAAMPETSGNEYYYGQNYYKLSTAGTRIMVPMVYTGNYLQTASWVGRVSAYIRNTTISQCQLYTGLQIAYDTGGYMTPTELSQEINYAVNSGAQGICAFRYPIQTNQFICFDTVGQVPSLSLSGITAIQMMVGQTRILSASGGWIPYAQWTVSQPSIGSISTFFGDASVKFEALSIGTTYITVKDSAPSPNTLTIPVYVTTTDVDTWVLFSQFETDPVWRESNCFL